MVSNISKNILLIDGHTMPLLGLGCWESLPGDVEAEVEATLDSGYRHIDTAYQYMNEEQIGKAIQNWLQKSGAKREELFIVTKLPMVGMHQQSVEKFLRLSLKKLNLEYVDLYLVHCPIGFQNKGDDDIFPKNEGKIAVDYGTDHISIWKEMERMVELGLTKSIGISNFSIKQTRRLLAISKIPPAVNQVEMHVYFQQKELLEFSHLNGIILTAYGPLGSPGRNDFLVSTDPDHSAAIKLLENPIVKLIADKHKVTPAQVLLRYLIQKDVVVIPKSVKPQRIKTNGDVFSFILDETDTAALLLLDKGEKGRSFLIPSLLGAEDHPEAAF